MEKINNTAELAVLPGSDQLLETRHSELLRSMRSAPSAGRIVEHLGEEFLVLPNVFPPYDDSICLLENMKIQAGEEVLDVGSGSGVLSVFAAKRAASHVVALDVNPDAVRNTTLNAWRHGVAPRIEARESDLFASIAPHEKFDVVLANLPFRNKDADDLTSLSIWDTSFMTHQRFFSSVRGVMMPQGRLYMVHPSFGELDMFRQLAKRAGFSARLLDAHNMADAENRIYYVFELKVH